MADHNITPKQKELINYLLTFRFLTIAQLQQLLKHKKHNRINEWLIDLLERKYINRIRLGNDITIPYIYCLGYKAKYLFDDTQEDKAILGRLYKEKKLTPNFINHCNFLAETYLYFLANQGKDAKLDFFTKHELENYGYFPENIPDAYLSSTNQNSTQSYFLDLFDEYTPLWVIRKRIKDYVQYFEDNTWQDGTKNSSFPTLLLVLQNERVKKHILHFGKAVLEKTFYDNIEFFLTTKEKIKQKGQDIWEKIE